MTDQSQTSDAGGCCEAPASPTPVDVRNRPGLSEISYRVGTFGSFRQAMIEAIASATVTIEGESESRRPLAGWTARTSDDYGIALLEMWAYVADILTFYQERTANEAFLRSAEFRESLLSLANTLDYIPAAGVAATTHLALFVEEGQRVNIPVGLLVQSVPGQNEKPQKFETVEPIEAISSLNRIGLRTTRPHKLVMRDTQATVAGTNLAVKPGSYVLVVGDELVAEPSSERWDLRRVERVEVDESRRTTTLSWNEGLGHKQFPVIHPAENPRLYVFRQQAWPFGYNAPNHLLVPSKIRELLTPSTWNGKKLPEDPKHRDQIYLDNIYEGLQASGWVALIKSDSPYAEVYQIREVVDTVRSAYTLTSRVTRLTVPTVGAGADQQAENIDKFPMQGTTIWVKSEELELAEVPIETPASGNMLVLDGHYPELQVGRKLILSGQLVGGDDNAATEIIQIAAVSHRIDATLGPPTLSAEDLKQPAGLVVRIQFHEDPLSEFLFGKLDDKTIQLLGFYQPENPPPQSLVDALVRDLNGVILNGPLYDAERFAEVRLSDGVTQLIGKPTIGADLHRLNRLLLEEAFPQDFVQTRRETSLALANPLDRAYVIESVRLFGNVALATHGERIAGEVLGSGDASVAFQKFALKKSPVTYVPMAGALNGAANTLEVHVDRVLWQETRSLLGRADDARVYIARIDNGEVMSVQFGDGQASGGRLPSGRNNVVAKYRQGIGPDGNVAAGSIKTLLDRPVALVGTTNPDAACGGAERESEAKIRQNVPNTVRTFGRIVSLRDFEDAAREFAGIAKANAFVDGIGVHQRVQLTVAGDEGAEVLGPVLENLVDDLDARRDPNRAMTAGSYTRVPIQIEVAIWINPDYVAEQVQSSAVEALNALMHFDNLDLGQPIHLSDVYKAVHDVQGVVAADANRLQFKNADDRQALGTTDAPVQASLPILATELAFIEDPVTDIAVTVETTQP